VRLSRDGWAGLVVLAASLVLFWQTLGRKGTALVPIGPGFYPRIVLGLTAGFALLLVVLDLLDRSKAKPPPQSAANYRAVVLHFVLFGIYVGLMPGIGFRISTFLYVAAANALMAPPRKPIEWLRVVLLALGTVVATYLAFDIYLTVLLPRGRWTDW
jgi:hypothetical protein